MANTAFETGSGERVDDGSYSTATTKAKSFDAYLFPQFEFQTAARAGAGITCTWSRRFSDTFSAFLKLSDDFTMLLQQPEYLGGRSRNCALITLGCDF